MAEDISIWRWAMTENLDARFAALVAASDAEFARLAVEIASEDEDTAHSIDETASQTEAKIRALGLPPDILEVTLAGLNEMIAEARAEEAAFADEPGSGVEDFGNDQIAVALASSHMFIDAPFASLGQAEIDRQVTALLDRYSDAITKTVGQPPQSLAACLDMALEQLNDDTVIDALMQAGVESAERIWISGDTAHFLSVWREDKDMPFDLGFHRIPTIVLSRIGTHR